LRAGLQRDTLCWSIGNSSKFEEVFAQEALSENVGSSLRYPDFVA